MRIENLEEATEADVTFVVFIKVTEQPRSNSLHVILAFEGFFEGSNVYTICAVGQALEEVIELRKLFLQQRCRFLASHKPYKTAEMISARLFSLLQVVVSYD